jgi:hypothetical protein
MVPDFKILFSRRYPGGRMGGGGFNFIRVSPCYSQPKIKTTTVEVEVTIFYNHEKETWLDSRNPAFKVSMTPECDPEELEREFDDFETFYHWYRGHDNG